MSAPKDTALARATAAWPDLPAWVEELARYVDARGLKAAGQKVGYSASTLSEVIGKKYKGTLSKVEARVRGALMGETVDCPQLGDMTRDRCLDWQGKPYAQTSSLRVAMYHACRSGCPHSRLKEGGDEA